MLFSIFKKMYDPLERRFYLDSYSIAVWGSLKMTYFPLGKWEPTRVRMGYGNTSQYQIQYQILISESLFTNPFTLFLIPKNQILRLGSRICDNDKLSMITYHLILMRHKLYRSTFPILVILIKILFWIAWVWCDLFVHFQFRLASRSESQAFG